MITQASNFHRNAGNLSDNDQVLKKKFFETCHNNSGNSIGSCLCSQNINKYSNKPAKGYERIIQRS